MIAVLLEYMKIRIYLVQLMGLSMLMSVLVLSIDNTLIEWLYSILFLVISFSVFRIVDDAFSVEIDRKEHPERTYLIPQRFNSFKKITAIISAIYLISIGLVFPAAFFIILSLLIGSLVLYLLLKKQHLVSKLIPLLKYPVLLYCLAMITSTGVELGVLFSSFLLMAGFDSFDNVKRNSKHIWQPMLLLLCCSILLYKPWLDYINILFSVLPILIIYVIKEKRITPYVLIVFFPITFFILTHL